MYICFCITVCISGTSKEIRQWHYLCLHGKEGGEAKTEKAVLEREKKGASNRLQVILKLPLRAHNYNC